MHLRNELPLAEDGHRPVSDTFRAECDRIMLQVMDELQIPYHVIGGALSDRLNTIVSIFDFPTVTTCDEAIALAHKEYAMIDVRIETERVAARKAQ